MRELKRWQFRDHMLDPLEAHPPKAVCNFRSARREILAPDASGRGAAIRVVLNALVSALFHSAGDTAV